MGSIDVVENFDWPAPTQVQLTVVDATSVPTGWVRRQWWRGDLQEPLSDGITSVSLSYSMPSYPANTCTTDGAGQCALPGLVGATTSFYSTYQQPPGGTNYPTFYVYVYPVITAASNVTIQFTNLAQVASVGSVLGPVQVAAPDGTTLSGVTNQVVPGNTLPSGATVLAGALTYQLSGLAAGSSITVTLQLPAGSNPTSVFKSQTDGSYLDISSIAAISGNIITLTLTDGVLPGDSDGSANGTIVDPVIAVRLVRPGAPTLGPVTGGNASASVIFTAPATNGGSPILDYTATCNSSNGGAASSATSNGSPLAVAALTNDRAYNCTVTARNAVGSSVSSAASNSFTPAAGRNQTINFGNLANKTMAQSPLTVSATASSGLAVTFTTSTPLVCTASGNNGKTITLIGPGTCTVEADQAGNAVYNPALSVSRNFTVTKLNQTINFGNLANKTMVQSPLTVSATASSGLVVAFTTSTPAVCTAGGANGKTISLVGPGTCTVVGSQAGNAVYNFASAVSRNFTVTKVNQTINFGDLPTRTMAQSPVTVHATASSSLVVTFTTSTASICTAGGINGATITLLRPGTCTVVGSQAGNTVYNPAATVSRSFKVK